MTVNLVNKNPLKSGTVSHVEVEIQHKTSDKRNWIYDPYTERDSCRIVCPSRDIEFRVSGKHSIKFHYICNAIVTLLNLVDPTEDKGEKQ